MRNLQLPCPESRIDAPLFSERAAMCCLLVVAAALRLYHLGVPSMWWDEVLVPLTARFPVPYIFERALSQDFHPPLFYLIIKTILACGQSDFILRFVPAMAGVAGVYLIYRLGRAILSPATGLFAAVLLATSPLHLLLSREVRPYTLVFDLSLLSLWGLLSILRHPRSRPLLGLTMVNFGLVMLHFSGLLVVGAEGGVLVGWVLARRDRQAIKIMILFSIGATLAVGLVLPFLLGSWGANAPPAGNKDLAAMAILTADRLGEALSFLPSPLLRALLITLTALGLFRIWVRDRTTSLALAGFVLLPLLAIIAAHYSTYFNPWHLTLLLPAALLSAGAGLVLVFPWRRYQPFAATLLCLLLACPYPFLLHKRFYETLSHTGPYKSLARRLVGLMHPGEAAFFGDQGLANAVNWYVHRFAAPDPLIWQGLSPSNEPAGVLFITTGDFGHLAKTEKDFFAIMGRPKTVTVVDRARIYRFALSRTPIVPLGPLPSRLHLTMLPNDLYGRAYALHNVACLPLWGGRLIATANNLPGDVEYIFENKDLRQQRLRIFFGFKVSGVGNLLTVSYAFDDEPWQKGFHLMGLAGEGDSVLDLTHQRPYRLFRLRFSLLCADRTPVFPGGNLESLQLKDFKVYVDPVP